MNNILKNFHRDIIDSELRMIRKSMKTNKKFSYIFYFLFVCAIVLTPYYFYIGSYFNGTIWLFNLLMNTWNIRNSLKNKKKNNNRLMELLKEYKPIEYKKILRKKKFKQLGIK